MLGSGRLPGEAALEEGEDNGLFGAQARDIIAKLALDLFTRFENQRFVQIAVEHLRVDIAFAADCRRVDET